MPGDRSRSPDRPRHGYTGVVAQQGRVILDRDFNAAQTLTAARIAADALDEIGPCGTPDDGFRVTVPAQWPSDPALWSPPLPPPVESPPVSPGEPGDFLISPGTMYLGGQRVEFPGEQRGAPISYSYFDQPDWPVPERPSGGFLAHELVYLKITEQEVSAVEDPDLLEVALGGPDTTQRLRLLRRVRRFGVASADCAAAFQAAIAAWREEGLQFDPATMRLLPAVRLLVGFTNDGSDTDLCDPVTTGGYLGPDNQLIRVRIDTSNGSPRLIWGYDNASFLYRATVDPADHTQLTLAGGPPDAFHFPATNQLVEVLRTACVLGVEPDESDTGGSGSADPTIDRVTANAVGLLFTLNQSYGPTTANPTTNVLVLPRALPGEVVNDPLPLFVRAWETSIPVAAGGTYTLVDAAGNSTGITVTISAPSGTALANGAFWQIAVRPSTPQGVYPEELLTSPQPPDGPREWVCPLAVLNRTSEGGATVIDCRNPFDNLVELTRRKPGCCTVTIEPRDVTAATTLQMLIDRAATRANSVTVCLGVGTYTLPAPLHLNATHAGMTLESCGGSAVLTAGTTGIEAGFADGLVIVTNAKGITLRGLELTPPHTAVPLEVTDLLLARLSRDLTAQGRAAISHAYAGFGVHVFNAANLTIDRCLIQFDASRFAATDDLLAAAVFVRGACPNLAIQGCQFVSKVAPTHTQLSVDPSLVGAPSVATFNRAMDLLRASMSLPSPPPPPPSPLAGGQPSEAPLAGAQLAGAQISSTPQTSPPLSSPPPDAATRVAEEAVTAPLAATTAGTSANAATAASVDPSTALDEQITARLEALVAARAAVPFATEKVAVIATVGVLAVGAGVATIGNRFSHVGCELGAASVRDTVFTGLTFASWCSASATTLRIQDNNVTGGVAGLWLEVPGSVIPANTNYEQTSYYPQIQEFQEFQLLQTLAVLFPLPADTTIVPATETAATGFDLYVDGNQVRLLATGNATAALLLALNGAPAAIGTPVPDQTAIVSGNNLRTSAGQLAPTVLLTLPTNLPCTLTGNVIVNVIPVGDRQSFGPSLTIVVDRYMNSKGTELLAITGNAMTGPSNLWTDGNSSQSLNRAQVPAADNWHFSNADPS